MHRRLNDKPPLVHKESLRMRRLILALSIASFVGCSDNGLEVVPVEGSVTFEDRDRPAVCRILFLPDQSEDGSPTRPSIAEMQPGGDYRITPFQGISGLMPGTYQVRVTYYDLKPGADPDSEASWIAHNYDAPQLQIDPGSGHVEYTIAVP